MKKYLLIAALFTTFAAHSQGLIVNNSFNYWAVDTYYFAAGTVSGIPADTIIYQDPVGWTSSNAISGLDSLGNQILVTPDSMPYWDTLAITMKTKLITLAPTLANGLAGGAFHSITLPGFVLNGTFPIGVGSLLSNGFGTITPASIKGAGTPCTQRLASIGGYINYVPEHNDSTGLNDSCMIYATLRKGNEIIANAIFKASDTTGGWKPFTANFNYVACDAPDTLVILMASSVPNVTQLVNQSSSGLKPGSVFSVDSFYYDTLPNTYAFPVWAADDYDTVLENSTNNLLNVTHNDNSCNDLPLTASIVSGPGWGTATVASDSTLSYTPTAGYNGPDTIVYKSSNTGNSSADASVFIWVLNPSAITDVNQLALSIYPVPTSSWLNVYFQNPGKTYGRIYDMVGKLVGNATFTSNNNTIDVSTLAGGMYCMELVNADSKVVARSKFTVTK